MREASFNPKTKGAMAVIADQGSPEYYYHAAIICIEEAKAGDKSASLRAIQLLTLARIYDV